QTGESSNKKHKFYTANPDVYGVIRTILMNREAGLISNVLNECQNLHQKKEGDPDLNGVDLERLETLVEMTRTAHSALRVLISPPGLSSELIRFLFFRK
ncbi:MAG: hypothetical protein EBX52_04995, partial [Proteobacteria bacterium]|nr:hypothetical protein [Pseudomonadota bacterium]